MQNILHIYKLFYDTIKELSYGDTTKGFGMLLCCSIDVMLLEKFFNINGNREL